MSFSRYKSNWSKFSVILFATVERLLLLIKLSSYANRANCVTHVFGINCCLSFDKITAADFPGRLARLMP